MKNTCHFPEHHRQPDGGDSSALAWVVLLAVIIAAGASSAVRGLVTDLVWAAVAAVATAVAVAVTVLVVRRHRRKSRRPAASAVVMLTAEQIREAMQAADIRPAITSPQRDVSAYRRDDVPTYVVTRGDEDWWWSR